MYAIASSLGDALRWQGTYEEAQEFLYTALEGRRSVLGEGHRATLITLTNLRALLNDDLEDYEGALRLLQLALAEKSMVLGKTHPDTQTAMQCLGCN